MDKKLMKQIETALPGYKHTVKGLSFKDWEVAGKPCQWTFAAQDGHAVVYQDIGYGFIALFEDGQLVDVHNGSFVVGNNYIVYCDNGIELFRKVDH